MHIYFGCYRVVTQKMYKFLQRVVNEVMEYREKNNVIRADFLQHLITLYKKGGGTADGKDLSSGNEQKGLPPAQNITCRASPLLSRFSNVFRSLGITVEVSRRFSR